MNKIKFLIILMLCANSLSATEESAPIKHLERLSLENAEELRNDIRHYMDMSVLNEDDPSVHNSLRRIITVVKHLDPNYNVAQSNFLNQLTAQLDSIISEYNRQEFDVVMTD
ncbi:MAG: hypothetical protein P4L22_01240 [Candidatus Babeliales bacterium]|nr:hypothetical protein [Candidatus Babeliales bacterium]